MMTDAQISALEAAAKSWVGTPFCEGTPVKGAGVACHHLTAEIYFEAGLMDRIPIPNGPSNYRGDDKSLIAEWVEASGLFIEVKRPPICGDLLGFRILRTIHHAAIMLRGGRLVHSIKEHGVQIAPQLPAAWAKRLDKVWRLKSLA